MNEHIKHGLRMLIRDEEWDAWLAGYEIWEAWLERNKDKVRSSKKEKSEA